MGRTFLDIDMARAADLLGMERRQADASATWSAGNSWRWVRRYPAVRSDCALAQRIASHAMQRRG
jgi:hypothetical protein